MPVIVLTLQPKEQQAFFTADSIKCSAKDGASIVLFANPPLQEPRIVVSDVSYLGVFDGDKHNVRFDMPEIKRKGHYEADIYDGNRKVAALSFEAKRSTGENDLF